MALNRPHVRGSLHFLPFFYLEVLIVATVIPLFLFTTPLLLVLVYVDDILVTRKTSQAISSLVHEMHTAFSMKDHGSISYFLGLIVAPKGHGYSLTQAKYAIEILAKAGMLNCKPCASTLATISTSPLFSQPSLYRSIVGGLQYLTITRPDLAFAMSGLSAYGLSY